MNFIFWDWLILNLLAGQACLIVLINKTKLFQWQKATKAAATVLLLFGFSVVFYGSFIEPNFIIIRHETVDLSNGSSSNDHIRLALVSDIHLGPYHGAGFVKDMISKVRVEKPDALIMDGDFVYSYAQEAAPLSLLKNLDIPKFATLGNHDYHLVLKNDNPIIDQEQADEIKNILEDAGVTVLVNQPANFENKVWLVGLDEYWTGRASLSVASSGIHDAEPRIVIVHNPDAVTKFNGDQADLSLAGHTHGGQIRLPFIGPVGRIPTELGQHYDKGFFDIDGYKTFITSGLGTSGPRARLFNPPEVVILDIKI